MSRIETIAETEGVSIEQAKRIRELEAVGWAISRHIDAELALDALKQAIPPTPTAAGRRAALGTAACRTCVTTAWRSSPGTSF